VTSCPGVFRSAFAGGLNSQYRLFRQHWVRNDAPVGGDQTGGCSRHGTPNSSRSSLSASITSVLASAQRRVLAVKAGDSVCGLAQSEPDKYSGALHGLQARAAN